MTTITRLKRYFTDLPRTKGVTVAQVAEYLLGELEWERELTLRFESGPRAGRTGTLFARAGGPDETPIPGVSKSVVRGVLTYLSALVRRSPESDAVVYGGAGTVAFELPSRAAVTARVEFVNTPSEQRLSLVRTELRKGTAGVGNGSHSSLHGVLVHTP